MSYTKQCADDGAAIALNQEANLAKLSPTALQDQLAEARREGAREACAKIAEACETHGRVKWSDCDLILGIVSAIRARYEEKAGE